MESTMCANKNLAGEEREMVGAFSVECPECGAPPGFACRKPEGKGLYDSHKARRERAYAQALALAHATTRRLEDPVHAHNALSWAFISLHLHAPLQDEGLHSAAWRPSESILMALKGNLCRIPQMDFREFTF